MSLPPAEIAFQQAHAGDDRQPAVIAALVVTYTFAVASVALRLLARHRLRAKLAADDWLMLLALLLATGYTIGIILNLTFGLARHAIFSPNPEAFLHNSLSVECIYAWEILAVKLSILSLYLRLFPGKRFKLATYIMMAIVTSYSLASFFSFLFQCVPIEASWDTSVKGKCIDISAAFEATGAINVVTDASILALPIPQLWNLNLATSRKLQLIGIFLLGGFVCIISIVRVVFVGRVSVLDAQWTFTDATIWTQAEVCVAVISANLPTYRPLIRRVDKTPSSSKITGSYASGGVRGFHKPGKYSRMGATDTETNFDEERDAVPLGVIRSTVNVTVESEAANEQGQSAAPSHGLGEPVIGSAK